MKKLILPIFFILFLIYPFSYSLNNGLYLVYGAFLLIIILKLKDIILNKCNIKIPEKIKKTYPIIIVIIAIITRIISAILLNENIVQVSDFQTAMELSSTMQFEEPYHRIFTHWILLPKITNFLFNIFGNSQLVALIFNGVICSITSIFIYFVTNKIIKNKNISFLASLLYLLWPANILYVGIFTPEHITQLLLIIGVFLILKSNEQKNKIIKYFSLLIAGMMLGMTTFFKNFGIVFIVALFIYYVLKLIFNRELFNKNNIIVYILSIIVVLIGNLIATKFTYNYLDKLVGKEVSRSNTACYLLVGLDSRGNGEYNKKLYQEYFDEVINNNYNYKQANKNILYRLKNDLKNNDKIFDLLDRKARIIVGGDESRLGFVTRSIKEKGNNEFAEYIEENLIDINNYYYMILFILIGIGILRFKKEINLEILYIYISIYGSYLLLLLVEAQNRYSYGINPFICILAAIGFEYLMKQKKTSLILIEEGKK